MFSCFCVLAQNETDPLANQTSPEVKAELEKAVAAFNASRFADTLEILKSLYAKHPELVPPRIILAQWFAKSNLGNAVKANLEMGTEEVPEDPEAFLLLAEISLRQGSLTAAETLLYQAADKVKAYTLNPARKKNLSRSLRRVVTELYEARQRWQEMEESVNQQIEADEPTPELLRKKGIAVFQQKKDDEAKKIFIEADKLDAGSEKKGLPADAVMSQLYLLRGDKENAGKSLEAALTAFPNSKEVLALSIQARVNDDRLEEAKQLAEKLLAEDPNSPSVKRLRATIALYLDDYPTAEKLFEELLLADPLEAQNKNGLALALCEQDSPEKLRRSLAYAAENVQKDQNNSEYL
ncbi:MAG: tetratricopeptide repeat protein, partial [Planctomycetaceae bacterium]|nr:tetratricopeptide repeat protein [Planctomycetaceae bacterium]